MNLKLATAALLFYCFSGMLLLHAQDGGKAVIAYYSGSPEALDKYNPRNFTHIIFCFGKLKGNQLHLRGLRDTLIIRKMVAMKKVNPNLKVLLSLGGWGGCETCSAVFSSRQGISDFSRSVRKLTRYFDTDGIDLDWEYPSISGYPGHRYDSSDKKHFTSLVKALRRDLGKKKIITFAAGGFDRFIEHAVDWEQVMPVVDYVNLMTYDLVGGGSPKTGHHTALYSTPWQKQSADNCVRALLTKGVPSHKMILGAAFYARTWDGVSSDMNGRYQSGTFRQYVGYSQFPSKLSRDSGYTYFWDSLAMAPYAYHQKARIYATFDDAQSVALKTNYVLKMNLGGIMFWQLGHDLPEGGLVDGIHKALKRN